MAKNYTTITLGSLGCLVAIILLATRAGNLINRFHVLHSGVPASAIVLSKQDNIVYSSRGQHHIYSVTFEYKYPSGQTLQVDAPVGYKIYQGLQTSQPVPIHILHREIGDEAVLDNDFTHPSNNWVPELFLLCFGMTVIYMGLLGKKTRFDRM